MAIRNLCIMANILKTFRVEKFLELKNIILGSNEKIQIYNQSYLFAEAHFLGEILWLKIICQRR